MRQDSNTADLIFGPQALVDFIAETITLEPGDIILTGTPEGVGQAMDPPRFLADGDVVRIEIEGLGVIEHDSIGGPRHRRGFGPANVHPAASLPPRVTFGRPERHNVTGASPDAPDCHETPAHRSLPRRR